MFAGQNFFGVQVSTKKKENRLLKKLQKNNSKQDIELVAKALRKLNSLNAELFHSEAKVAENLECAETLAELNASPSTIIAALLSSKRLEKKHLTGIKNEFGQETESLIENKLMFENTLKSEKTLNAKNSEMKKLLFYSLAKNIKLILMVIADRLMLLKKIQTLSDENKKELIDEEKEILIPLSHKLGILNIKSEAEDLVFKYTDPTKFIEISDVVQKERQSRRKDIEKITDQLVRKAKEKNVSIKISGRTKSIQSIFNKMNSKVKTIGQIHDIIALRVVCQEIKDCYEMLGIVHSLWKPLPEEFDDYITKPKPNGYRSLHTTVMGPENKSFEIQIRTQEMHSLAEYGMASHWKYKGHTEQQVFDKKISWLNELLAWQKEIKEEPTKIAKVDFFGDNIYVLSPKGDTVELPRGATVLDFAYAIHEDLGYSCVKAKVNNETMPLNHQLETADVVEIITSFSQKPKIQWLSFVLTEKAKRKIKQSLQIAPKKTKSETIINNNAIKTTHKDIRFAKCCRPVPGDNITGFKTTKRKISVHREDCSEIQKFPKNSNARVEWDLKQKLDYSVELQVVANERAGLLSEILNAFSAHNITVLDAKAKFDREKANCTFKIETKNLAELEKTIQKLNTIQSVEKVERV